MLAVKLHARNLLPLFVAALGVLTAEPARPAGTTSNLEAAYEAVNGPYSSSSDEIVWQDAQRSRTIKTLVHAPVGVKGRLPLVLFSPGLGGSHKDYAYLGRAWSSHGYIVVTFDHPGSNRDIFEAGGAPALAKALADRNNVVLRANDVRFILNRLFDGSDNVLNGRIDGTRIAMAGHSYGAHTTMVLSGLTFGRLGEANHPLTDNRIAVSIAMGTQGIEDRYFGTNARSWDTITIPVMTMTGTLDKGSSGQDYTWRNEAYEHMKPGDKYNVVIEGAGHNSYYDQAPLIARGKPERDPRHFGWIEMTTLAYLDAYLKHHETGKLWLRSNKPDAYTGGEMKIDWK
jgi:predicted dienelactone hydrolase